MASANGGGGTEERMRTRVRLGDEAALDVTFRLAFPHEALSVPLMRRLLGDTLRRLGADEDAVADLLLAVTEACTNVLKHAGPGRRYEVVVSVGKPGCRVEVVNGDPGFGPRALPTVRRVFSPSAHAPARIRRRARHPEAGARRHRWSRQPAGGDDSIASLPESGRGLAIMRACVDDVTLTSGPGRGTVVCLRKRMAWNSGALVECLPDSDLENAG